MTRTPDTDSSIRMSEESAIVTADVSFGDQFTTFTDQALENLVGQNFDFFVGTNLHPAVILNAARSDVGPNYVLLTFQVSRAEDG